MSVNCFPFFFLFFFLLMSVTFLSDVWGPFVWCLWPFCVMSVYLLSFVSRLLTFLFHICERFYRLSVNLFPCVSELFIPCLWTFFLFFIFIFLSGNINFIIYPLILWTFRLMSEDCWVCLWYSFPCVCIRFALWLWTFLSYVREHFVWYLLTFWPYNYELFVQ